MRRLVLLIAVASFAFVGCNHNQRQGSCRSCGPGGWGANRQAQRQADFVPPVSKHFYKQTGPAGPPSAAVAYPYYTTRAPRDFLMDQPPTIGN